MLRKKLLRQNNPFLQDKKLHGSINIDLNYNYFSEKLKSRRPLRRLFAASGIHEEATPPELSFSHAVFWSLEQRGLLSNYRVNRHHYWGVHQPEIMIIFGSY